MNIIVSPFNDLWNHIFGFNYLIIGLLTNQPVIRNVWGDEGVISHGLNEFIDGGSPGDQKLQIIALETDWNEDWLVIDVIHGVDL